MTGHFGPDLVVFVIHLPIVVLRSVVEVVGIILEDIAQYQGIGILAIDFLDARRVEQAIHTEANASAIAQTEVDGQSLVVIAFSEIDTCNIALHTVAYFAGLPTGSLIGPQTHHCIVGIESG